MAEAAQAAEAVDSQVLGCSNAGLVLLPLLSKPAQVEVLPAVRDEPPDAIVSKNATAAVASVAMFAAAATIISFRHDVRSCSALCSRFVLYLKRAVVATPIAWALRRRTF